MAGQPPSNGEPAEIEKVNVGFMAVKVPAGTSEIRFDYYTPGLNAGIAATAGSVGIFLLYVFGMGYLDKRRAKAMGLDRLPVDNGIVSDFALESHHRSKPEKKTSKRNRFRVKSRSQDDSNQT